jgi:FMN phosphatase YigB (HAD superfamily)
MLPNSLRTRPAALLLDAGDTLIFMDYHVVALALRELGLQLTEAALEAAMFDAKAAYQTAVRTRAQHEDGWTIIVRQLLLGAGVAPADAQRALAPLRAQHDDFYFWRRAQPKLPDALDRARAGGIRLGVVSNSEGRLESVLARIGLASHFELIVDSQLEGVTNPEIFRRALRRMQVAPEQSIYAGDLPEVDLVGAHNAGMHAVVVDAFGHYAAQPELPRVQSVMELVDALLQLPAA